MLRILDSKKFINIFNIKKKIYLNYFKNKFYIYKNIRLITILIFGIFPSLLFQKQLLPGNVNSQFKKEKNNIKNSESNSVPQWIRINPEKKFEQEIIWKKTTGNHNKFFLDKEAFTNKDFFHLDSNQALSSFNRSIVFNDSLVGPDISWLVPPGFKWNNKYKFDASVRGHSGRFEKGRKGKSFWGWNSGDAVGQFYYQFLNNEKTSFGLNFGIRSIYSGSGSGGKTKVGEGQSLGFRIDREISKMEGISFGAEQLLHFDGKTDSGRDIYLTLSKGIWSNNETGKFPLDIYTFGIATGRMAEGNIKFLCSDLFGGAGTEEFHQRRLCWAPVFSISRIFNKKFSTFFEYNSKWFLLGSSIIPFNEIPLRGTFAVQLSDHTDNYKLNNFDEMKWVFRLSLGF